MAKNEVKRVDLDNTAKAQNPADTAKDNQDDAIEQKSEKETKVEAEKKADEKSNNLKEKAQAFQHKGPEDMVPLNEEKKKDILKQEIKKNKIIIEPEKAKIITGPTVKVRFNYPRRIDNESYRKGTYIVSRDLTNHRFFKLLHEVGDVDILA